MTNELRKLWREVRKALKSVYLFSADILDDMLLWAKENPKEAKALFIAILALVSSGDVILLWDVVSPFL